MYVTWTSMQVLDAHLYESRPHETSNGRVCNLNKKGLYSYISYPSVDKNGILHRITAKHFPILTIYKSAT